jgi:hypothetical protein
MTSRRERLKKLVSVQEQLKALHETRRAGFLAAAAEAEAEERALMAHFDAGSSVSSLFPDLYHRRIAAAAARREQALEEARREAALIATATARTNMVERAYHVLRRHDERQRGERETLELIEQKMKRAD